MSDLLPATLETVAITFGALSGALHATTRRFDPLGVLTIALLCAVGGGLLRDVLLQRGLPALLVDPLYIRLACLAAVVGYFFGRIVDAAGPAIVVVDTALIGAWVLIGAEKAIAAGLPAFAAIALGVLTATGGGLLRNLLCRTVPPALTQPGEWYGLSAILAAGVFVGLLSMGTEQRTAEIATLAVAALTRTVSLVTGWRTPTAADLRVRVRSVRLRAIP